MNTIFTIKFICFVFAYSVLSINMFGQYQYFAESYNELSTIAGKGEIDDRGKVDWLPEYENGNALDAELTRPHFAMADSLGNIYIADKDAHGIRKVTPNGLISTVAGTNIAGDNGDGPGIAKQLSSPNGLWVNKGGIVYILDLGNNKIRRLDTQGNLETVVHDTDGISLGRGLWLSASEDTIFYASGSHIKSWTKESGIKIYSSGYRGLGNITMDKNGFLVVTDRTANLVYRVSKDGKSKEIIAGNGLSSGGGENYLATETGLFGVRGVWFLNDNSYFVATHEGSQIWYIDVLGRIHLFLNGKDGDQYHSGDGENYRTPGYKISEPRSVSVDHEGNVLIVENDKGFVRKIENEYVYYYTNLLIQNNDVSEIEIYPNPAKKQAKVGFNMTEPGKINFSLFNHLGQQLLYLHKTLPSAGRQSVDINTSQLQNGIYYFNLSTDTYNYSQKLIIRN